MLNIQMTTDIVEAQSSFSAALSGAQRSNATYHRMRAEYDVAWSEMLILALVKTYYAMSLSLSLSFWWFYVIFPIFLACMG